MTVQEQVLRLPKMEKLKLMEAIWEDLSKSEEQIESPSWHFGELAQTEQKLKEGTEEVLDWEEAKNKLRNI
jgi:hypothetical protein